MKKRFLWIILSIFLLLPKAAFAAETPPYHITVNLTKNIVTVYGKDAVAIAHNLALETMKNLKLVPIYDIPMAEEVGVYRTVSENTISYPSDEREDIVKVAEEPVLTVKENEAAKEDISSAIVTTEPVKAAEDKEVIYEKQENRKQGRSR